eukprot:5688042-Amphidinium_carterae.1
MDGTANGSLEHGRLSSNRHFSAIDTLDGSQCECVGQYGYTVASQCVHGNYDAQYSLNEYSIPCLVRSTDNGLQAVLNKCLEASGMTIKPQYVTADNGVERDHKQAMSLHRWHRGNQMVLKNQQMTMRINSAGNGTELQWTSPVTILLDSCTRQSQLPLRTRGSSSSTMCTLTTRDLTMTLS